MGELFGIKFAPLFIPLERRLQTLVAGLWIYLIMIGIWSPLLCVYLIFFTTYGYLVVLLYGLWMYLDRNVSNRGGRRVQWLRKSKIWNYFCDYFPIKLHRLENSVFDIKKNYLFCVYPHGILSTGFFGCFGTEACGFYEKFPGFEVYPIVLSTNFLLPFFREWCIAQGGCGSTEESINYLLSKPDGGNCVVLVLGGAAETFYCKPGSYCIILKRRRGFIRLALKNGTPLVPVFSFNETQIYTQLNNPPGSVIRFLQDILMKLTGFAFTVPIGRGFFQYSFGPLPHRKPITTVVGKPIEVEQIANPTNEQIDEYHQKFQTALIELFETEKYNYVNNPESTHLTIM